MAQRVSTQDERDHPWIFSPGKEIDPGQVTLRPGLVIIGAAEMRRLCEEQRESWNWPVHRLPQVAVGWTGRPVRVGAVAHTAGNLSIRVEAECWDRDVAVNLPATQARRLALAILDLVGSEAYA
jgi:hypothetical protein